MVNFMEIEHKSNTESATLEDELEEASWFLERIKLFHLNNGAIHSMCVCVVF